MAWKCEICGKRPLVGNNVSHANNQDKATHPAEPPEGARDGRRQTSADQSLRLVHPRRQSDQGGLVRPGARERPVLGRRASVH